ncbi:hypothetical protein GPALN_007814 [Globodera pallida]|nr:hypothetical protein GPALN_007814 [Globodera pallida]
MEALCAICCQLLMDINSKFRMLAASAWNWNLGERVSNALPVRPESLLNELQLGQIGKTASAGSTSADVGKQYAIVTFYCDKQQQSDFDHQHRRVLINGTRVVCATQIFTKLLRRNYGLRKHSWTWSLQR